MKKFEKPQKKNNRFYVGSPGRSIGFFFTSIIMLVKSCFLRTKIKKTEIQRWSCKLTPQSSSIDLVVTWVGHSSFLIQIGGVNILTDPVLGEASRLYPRYLQPGIDPDCLPNIDFVLLSHNHPDHMDVKSLLMLKEHRNTCFLVPKGDKYWFDRRKFDNSKEYTWWDADSFSITSDGSKQITFTFLPANHWSQRGLFDKNKSLWGSWMIECNGQKIYFAGDTSYDIHFKEIAKKFPNINVALLPIGPCEPREWVAHHHLDAPEAIKAFIDLQAHHFMPMHWGTLPLGAELFNVPIKLLQKSWQEHEQVLQSKRLHTPKAGQSIRFSSVKQDYQAQALMGKKKESSRSIEK